MPLTVVIGDQHIPDIDYEFARQVISFIRSIKPDTIILSGDLLDFTRLAKFDTVPFAGKLIQEEFDLGQQFLKSLRKSFSGRIIFTEGNHEFRLRKYLVCKARELYGLKGLSVEEGLDLKGFDIEYIKSPENAATWTGARIEHQGVYVGHFDMIRQGAGNTAKGLVEKYGVSILQSHTHRGGTYRKHTMDGRTLVGQENFCMCKLNPSYMIDCDWEQGFSLIKDGQIIPIEYKEGKLVFLNRRIS